MKTHICQPSDEMQRLSGPVRATSRMQVLIYNLLKRYPTGEIEALVCETENTPVESGVFFDNGWLGSYAANIVQRLQTDGLLAPDPKFPYAGISNQ